MLRRDFVLSIAAIVGSPAIASLARAQGAASAGAAGETNWLTRAAGASIAGFSSEFGAGWVAENLVPSAEQLGPDGKPIHELIWSSGSSAPFPHWVTIDLGQSRWLTTFVFNNALSEESDHPGISARRLELWVGDGAQALRKVAAFELARNQDRQIIAIEPVQSRFVKFNITSNWGHPWYTELGASMAFDDGRRPGDLASALKAKGRADLYGIYFDFGSATLRAESAPALAQILAFHKANPQQQLTIEGHTDNVGSDSFNLELSNKRAAAVVAELVKQGAAARQLTPVGRGATQPVAPNTTDAGRARNRRVTVVLA